LKQVTSWSHSKLGEFEKCKYRTFLMHVEKVPEPPRPLPKGKTEHANDRGTRIHQAAEDYVRGLRGDIIPELGAFASHIEMLGILFDDGKVSMEGEWGLDQNWDPTEWKGAWHRAKVDVIVHFDPTEALVIDYKSGRKFGNEIKHGEQMQLYAVGAFSRFPHLENVTTELWYVDQDEVTTLKFTRSQALRFKPRFHSRGLALTTCTDWPTNANIHSCKWCMYGPWGTGNCKDGVQKI
jgi:PD-(D/E)XK nuclease superfamily